MKGSFVCEGGQGVTFKGKIGHAVIASKHIKDSPFGVRLWPAMGVWRSAEGGRGPSEGHNKRVSKGVRGLSGCWGGEGGGIGLSQGLRGVATKGKDWLALKGGGCGAHFSNPSACAVVWAPVFAPLLPLGACITTQSKTCVTPRVPT